MTGHSGDGNQRERAQAAKERMNAAFDRLEHAIRRSILRDARATLDAINAPPPGASAPAAAHAAVPDAAAGEEAGVPSRRPARRAAARPAQDSLGNVKNLFDE